MVDGQMDVDVTLAPCEEEQVQGAVNYNHHHKLTTTL